MKKRLIITIDGPAGAGKTTVSKMLADRLGYTYIDTGALYRGIALEAISAGLQPDDDPGLEALCRNLRLAFKASPTGLRLFSQDRDITDRLRTPEVTMFASAASARPVVRQSLLGLQRRMARQKGVVFEGRDMGTVVFPDADIKLYLDADPKARAYRRYLQAGQRGSQTLDEVQADMERRDRDDSTRELAPLKPAGDAIIVNSTGISAEAVVERMLSIVEKAMV